MLSSLIALPVLALSVAAAPQYGGYGDASSSSSSMDMASMSSAAAPATTATGTSNTTTAAGAVHTVVVGGGPLTYQPNFVNAAIGDQVIFEFHAKNHSVTQSSFAAPCTYLDAGLNSGFVPVSANATVFPSWALTVEVSTPLWFYCMQGNHCKEGMGFAVNPTSEKTIEMFIIKAENTTVSNTTAPAITPSYNGTGIVAVNATGVAGVSSIAGSTSTAASAGATTTSTKSAGGKTVVGGLVALVAVAVGVIA